MTNNSRETDAVVQMVSGLPAHDVDRRRAELIREHCHAVMSRHLGRRTPYLSLAASFARRVVEPAAAASLGAIFLAEVARRALWLVGS